MATVIDSLIVTLGLDPKKFNKGQKDSEAALKKTKTQADKTNKALEDGAKKAAQAINKVKNEVLGLVVAFLGVRAVVSFGESITNSDAAMGRFANNVGMSTKELSGWEGAIQRAGGTADDMAQSIGAISHQMSDMQMGIQPSAEMQRALSMSHMDANKYLNSGTSIRERLLMAADMLHAQPAPMAMNYGKMLEFNPGTTQFLRKGRPEVEKMMDAYLKLNAVTDGDSAEAIRRKNAWLDLASGFEHIGRILITKLSPVFLDVLGDFLKFVSHKENIDKIVKSVDDLAKSLKNIDMQHLIDQLGTVLGLVGKIVDGMATIISPTPDKDSLLNSTDAATSLKILNNTVIPDALNNLRYFVHETLNPTTNTSSTKNNVTINVHSNGDPHAIAKEVNNHVMKNITFASHSQAGAN